MTDAWDALAAEFRALVAPLAAAAQDERARRALLAGTGWDIDALPGFPVADFVAAASGVTDAADALVEAAAGGGRGLMDIAGLLADAGALLQRIRDLSELASSPQVRVPDDAMEALRTLGEELANFLVVEHLARAHPRALHVARLLTLVQAAGDDGAITPAIGAQPGQPPLRNPVGQPRIRLDRLPELLRDPAGTLHDELLGPDGLQTVESARAVAGRLYGPLAALLAASGAVVTNGGDVPDTDPTRTLSFRLALPIDEVPVVVGADLRLLSDDEGGAGVGVAAAGRLEERWELRDWIVGLVLAGEAGEFVLRSHGVALPPGAGRLAVGATLARRAPEGEPAFRAGPADATRLDVGGIRFTGGIELTADQQDVRLGLELSDALLAVRGGPGDGFLATTLGDVRIEAPFEFLAEWSRSDGLRLRGAAGLAIEIPVDERYGPLYVGTLAVAVRADVDSEPPAVVAEISVGIALTLGPFAAVVNGIGMRATLSFPVAASGTGMGGFQLGFKPPNGVGLAIRTPAVSGGGFLELDYEAGRYSGVFELTIVETVSVKVIGIITTKLPDGSPGFALLLMITAEGFTPIQLGLGFVLTASVA